jgi:hypothetical protein
MPMFIDFMSRQQKLQNAVSDVWEFADAMFSTL